jgi:cyclase
MISCKVGEFVVTSVDNDGMMDGFDIDLIKQITQLTNVPIIAAGGGGLMEHYSDLFSQTKVQAVKALLLRSLLLWIKRIEKY